MAMARGKKHTAEQIVNLLRQYYWLRLWLESGAMSGRGTLPKTNEDMCDHIFTIGARA
jgi:hypothetical protein